MLALTSGVKFYATLPRFAAVVALYLTNYCTLFFNKNVVVATVVRCVTSGSDTSGFVKMSRESPRESHVRTGRVLVLSFLQFIDKQFLNVPLHVLCTFFFVL